MRSFKFYTESGDVVLHEGSRLEWDSIAGIGIPGSGTCIGIDRSVRGEPPAVGTWIDPNEQLRAWAAEVRASAGDWGRDLVGAKSGLDGEGGWLVMAGYDFDRAIQDRSIRVLDEIRDPATYRSNLRQRAHLLAHIEQKADLSRICLKDLRPDDWESIPIPDPARLQPCGNVHCDRDCCDPCARFR